MPVAGSYIYIVRVVFGCLLTIIMCFAYYPYMCVSCMHRWRTPHIYIRRTPPPPHTHTRPSLYIFSFLYVGTMRAARVKSKRGISRKHQPAREERETGYFISRPPRIEISLKSTLVLYCVIAVKLLTHFSGPGNTGRHTHTYLCGGRGLPIYYIMIIIVYYILYGVYTAITHIYRDRFGGHRLSTAVRCCCGKRLARRPYNIILLCVYDVRIVCIYLPVRGRTPLCRAYTSCCRRRDRRRGDDNNLQLIEKKTLLCSSRCMSYRWVLDFSIQCHEFLLTGV